MVRAGTDRLIIFRPTTPSSSSSYSVSPLEATTYLPAKAPLDSLPLEALRSTRQSTLRFQQPPA